MNATIFRAAQALLEANHAAAQELLDEAEAGDEDLALSQAKRFHALVEIFILGNKILKILGDYARNKEATHV